MERVACFGAKGRLPPSAVVLRPSSAAPSAEDLLRRVDSTATEDGEEGSSLARRRSRVSVSTGAAVLDRGAAKPQPNGVRPSSGAETSDGYSCGSNPEPQTWLRLLRPGTAALRKWDWGPGSAGVSPARRRRSQAGEGNTHRSREFSCSLAPHRRMGTYIEATATPGSEKG